MTQAESSLSVAVRKQPGWLVAVLALLCGVASPALAEELVVPGSGNPEYVLGRLAEAFNRQQTAHRIVVPASTGIAGAIRDVGGGLAVLGRAGRPLTAEERKKGLDFVALGRDPVVFVAGAGVTVRSITSDEAVGIYTGKYLDWSQLGGKPGPIRAIGREVTDASRQAIARQIRAFESLAYHDGVKVVHLDPQMVELLERYPASFGFLNRSRLLAARSPVVILALNGIEPSAANLIANRYPIWLEMGLIYNPDRLTPGARAFLSFVGSAVGMEILRQSGITPAP